MTTPARLSARLFLQRLAPVIIAGLCLSTTLTAQNATEAEPVNIALGQSISDTFSSTESHVYQIILKEKQYVLGAANQISVDVIVTIRNPEGETVQVYDTPARGPEVFQFDSRAAGIYEIVVTPFEDERGDYTIELERVETVATSPDARVDQLMATYDRPGVPGGVVAVVQDGEIIFAEAYGMANLTHDVPFTTETRTNIGSTSKQFTAMAIALLAASGELSLDDDVRTHIPELPDLGHTVTLRHLMTHTSGYREFLNLIAMTGRRLDEGDFIARDELISIVQRQPELQNIPGAEWNYNNTAFGLLTIVVERVTDQSFEDWMDANVFTPLGMENSFVRTHRAQIIPNSAQGYSPDEKGVYRDSTDLAGAMGAGGIYTSVADLAKWIANFETAQLGGADVIDEMTTSFVLNDGNPTGYGLGLFIDEFRGLRRIHHGGADTAHRSMLLYLPDIDAGVIALSNNAGFAAGPTADRVALAFFADHFEDTVSESANENDNETGEDAAADEFDLASFDATSFDELAGRYELEVMPGFILEFTRDGDELFTQATGQPKLKIVPTGQMEFKLVDVDASLTFNREDDGSVKSLTLHQNGHHLAKRIEAEAWAPDATELGAYAGRYYSEELETFYVLSVVDDVLEISHRRYPDTLKLSPTSLHEFSGSFPVAQIAFDADDAGAITGFRIGNGRTRDVRFERLSP